MKAARPIPRHDPAVSPRDTTLPSVLATRPTRSQQRPERPPAHMHGCPPPRDEPRDRITRKASVRSSWGRHRSDPRANALRASARKITEHAELEIGDLRGWRHLVEALWQCVGLCVEDEARVTPRVREQKLRRPARTDAKLPLVRASSCQASLTKNPGEHTAALPQWPALRL